MARDAERATATVVAEHAGSRLRTSSPRQAAPWLSALVALVAYGCFILLRLHMFNGDITRFVEAGADFIPQTSGATVGLAVMTHPNAGGYDGQFYYLLALDPFSTHPALPGAHFDLGAYRAQRILYPLLVWALSLGGRPALVPAMLVLVNLAAIVAIAWLAALAVRRMGLDPLLATMVAFYPGLMLSLATDLTEPVSMACALGGFVCAQDRRWTWVAVLLTLAVLGRETTALFALAMLLAALLARLTPLPALCLPALRPIPRAEWRGAALAGLTPLVIELLWQGALFARWGQVAILSGGAVNIGLPFVGIVRAPAAWLTNHFPTPLLLDLHYIEGFYLLALIALVVVTLWRRRQLDYLTLAWALFVLLGVLLTTAVLSEDWFFMRALMEFGVLSLLILSAARQPIRLAALLGTMAVWGMMFMTHIAT